MECTPKYLMFVQGSDAVNSNKFYNMCPLGDNTFKAEWGRVGNPPQSKIYPMSKWNSTYNSKIKKGYKDISDTMQEVIENSVVKNSGNQVNEFDLVSDINLRTIIKRLYDFANKAVTESYRVSSNVVTQAMVDKAQKLLDKMAKSKGKIDVEKFNEQLTELFTIIPRRMSNVSLFLADGKESFDNVLAREQSTLDTMAGQVYVPKKDHIVFNTSTEEVQENIFDKMGIEMEPVNEEEIKILKKAMGNMSDKFYQAWRVKNFETEKNFNEFVKEHDIKNIRLLCHGSRNQNWFNILKMGLKIRPAGAGYNGSMFNDGIYWSNPDKFEGGTAKSIGYTSLGGYWTKEYQNCGFIAFFDVALGDSYHIYKYLPEYSKITLDKLRKQESNPNIWSVHAHGGMATLRNDEIIVYNTNQMTVRYLVEIRNN